MAGRRAPNCRGRFLGSVATVGLGLWTLAGRPTVAQASDEGRLGLRYQAISEGLLVTSVTDGMGADDAGIQPGSLIVSAGEHSLVGAPSGLRSMLIGPAGTEVVLGVVAPLATDAAPITVVRKLPGGRNAKRGASRPEAVRAYRAAVREQSRRKAVAATRAMVATDFGGMQPREAVGASLATAMRRGDRFAREIALVLSTETLDDPFLLQGLARVLLQTGEPEQALALLERRAELVVPDLLLADGETAADAGGGFQARALHVDAAMQTGHREDAVALARSLLQSHRDPGVGNLVSMAVAEPTRQWVAVLPPVEPFEVPLLDGSTWSSASLEGKVTVVNFWATWCGPCKRELPELATLYTERNEDGVEILAVSTDSGDVEPVRAMADSMSLPFAVGHAPELQERFAVSALPAIRVLGPDGALHYSARGFGEGAMDKLEQAIDQALEGGATGGAPIASTWGTAAEQVVLKRFFPVAGAVGVAVSDSSGLAVGALGASPTLFHLDGTMAGEASVEATRGQPGARLGWLDGVVGGDPGRFLIRKWDSNGLSEWLRTMPEPIVDLVTTSTDVWVAGAEHLYIFDGTGQLLHTESVALTDLAVTGDAVLGVGPDVQIRGSVARPPVPTSEEQSSAVPAQSDARGSHDVSSTEGTLVESPPEPVAEPAPSPAVDIQHRDALQSAAMVSKDGDLASPVARFMVSGRFGPDGARRVAVIRADDRLVILDEAGAVELVAELRRGGPMVAMDPDGDGIDALFVTIPDHGVAWLEFQNP